MRIVTNSTSPKNNSSARVVDGKLILTYPEALTPVVWQMDLTQARASALEVRDGTKGSILVLKNMKGETVDIAPFATREEAVAALMGVARALEKGQGHIRPVSMMAANESGNNEYAAPRKGGGKWVAGFLGMLLLVVLFGFWGALAPQSAVTVQGADGSVTSKSQPSFGGRDEPGVPLSADEFLMKRK